MWDQKWLERGVNELLAGKSKKWAHVQMLLIFRRVINFRKEHVQKPSHPNTGVLIWRFWKVVQIRLFSFFHLKINFSLEFFVSSCVSTATHSFFMYWKGKILNTQVSKEGHSQISRYFVSKKKSSMEAKIFIFKKLATLKVIFLDNLRMHCSWKHNPVCQGHEILSLM